VQVNIVLNHKHMMFAKSTMFHDMLLHINPYALPAFTIFSRIYRFFFCLLLPKKRDYNNTYNSFFI